MNEREAIKTHRRAKLIWRKKEKGSTVKVKSITKRGKKGIGLGISSKGHCFCCSDVICRDETSCATKNQQAAKILGRGRLKMRKETRSIVASHLPTTIWVPRCQHRKATTSPAERSMATGGTQEKRKERKIGGGEAIKFRENWLPNLKNTTSRKGRRRTQTSPPTLGQKRSLIKEGYYQDIPPSSSKRSK